MAPHRGLGMRLYAMLAHALIAVSFFSGLVMGVSLNGGSHLSPEHPPNNIPKDLQDTKNKHYTRDINITMPGSKFAKIDVHSHFLPGFYRLALEATGNAHVDGMPGIPEWSVDDHLAMMKRVNISHAILSISSPGVSFYHTSPRPAKSTTSIKEDVIALAIECNDAASIAAAMHPDKFSFWATLPLPHVDEAIAEVDRVSGEKGYAGVGVMSSYPEPKGGRAYLGDELFDELWTALNAKETYIFIHPTTPSSSVYFCNSSYAAKKYPAPLMEFFFETARTASSLILSDVPNRFPNLRFILSHAGGAFPPLVSRLALFSQLGLLDGPSISEDQIIETLNTRFYYDVAGSPLRQIAGLGAEHGMGIKDVDGRMAYGSDFPFTNAEAVANLAEMLESGWGEGVQRVFENGRTFLKEQE